MFRGMVAFEAERWTDPTLRSFDQGFFWNECQLYREMLIIFAECDFDFETICRKHPWVLDKLEHVFETLSQEKGLEDTFASLRRICETGQNKVTSLARIQYHHPWNKL